MGMGREQRTGTIIPDSGYRQIKRHAAFVGKTNAMPATKSCPPAMALLANMTLHGDNATMLASSTTFVAFLRQCWRKPAN